MATYELYRKSTLGACLSETLESLIAESQITRDVGQQILQQFDEAMNERLQDLKSRTTFKGKLNTYRFCDNVWTLILQGARFRTENQIIEAPAVKIVACAEKQPEEATATTTTSSSSKK
eukprot:gnl/Trimastix_PCT/1633.p1 GENE.gnl/Trimastix_PCT/1633~~gnl/Trimastix_PCT/1633.p1  ORF type:complete len:119 (+),score=5.41 gnl/Trimastix_PCT/1633:59-415(+)